MGQNAAKQGFGARRPTAFNGLAPRINTIEIGGPKKTVSVDNVSPRQSALRPAAHSQPRQIQFTPDMRHDMKRLSQIQKPEILTENPYMLIVTPPPVGNTAVTRSQVKSMIKQQRPLKSILKKKDRKTSLEIQVDKNSQIVQSDVSIPPPSLEPIKPISPISVSPPIRPQHNQPNQYMLTNNNRQINYIKNNLHKHHQTKKQTAVLLPHHLQHRQYQYLQHPPQKLRAVSPSQQYLHKQNPIVPNVPLINSIITEPPLQIQNRGYNHQTQGNTMTQTAVFRSSNIGEDTRSVFRNQLSLLSFVDETVNSEGFNSAKYRINSMWINNT